MSGTQRASQLAGLSTSDTGFSLYWQWLGWLFLCARWGLWCTSVNPALLLQGHRLSNLGVHPVQPELQEVVVKVNCEAGSLL